MTSAQRKALYALVPAVVSVCATYGLVTQDAAVLWINVGTLAVGSAYAASQAYAAGVVTPELRKALYVLLPAVVSVLGAYLPLDVSLWTSVALAFASAGLAMLHIDPDPNDVVS